MDNMKRCPQCHLQPLVEMKKKMVTLICEQHGHMAVGFRLEMAVKHWNRYISFVEGSAS